MALTLVPISLMPRPAIPRCCNGPLDQQWIPIPSPRFPCLSSIGTCVRVMQSRRVRKVHEGQSSRWQSLGHVPRGKLVPQLGITFSRESTPILYNSQHQLMAHSRPQGLNSNPNQSILLQRPTSFTFQHAAIQSSHSFSTFAVARNLL